MAHAFADTQCWARGRSTTRPSSQTAALAVLAVLLCGGSARLAHAGLNVWTSIGPANISVNAIAIDPATPTTLYAATNTGVFKSTDSGMSWQANTSGLPADPIAVLAIDPLTPQTLYAGAPPSGVFKSTDGGISWNAMNTGLADLFVSALAIDPHTPSTLYAAISDYSGPGGGGVFTSTNGGESWQESSSGLPAQPVCNFVLDPLNPQTLYASTPLGTFRTTDGGVSWSRRGTFGCFSDLAIDPHMPSTLYGAAVGVLKSTDGGSTWDFISPTGDYEFFQAVAVDPVAPSTVYAAAVAYAVGVWKSADGGVSWQAMNNGAADLHVNPKALAMSAGPPKTLYAGTGTGVYAIQLATFTVNSTADAPDAMPGDGVCATADGACTLHAAVDEANALPGGSTINVPAGTYPGGLVIDVDLSLRGAGAASTRIDGGGPVLQVNSGAHVDIQDVTIQGGHASYSGGGIVNRGEVALTNVIIRGNSAESGGSVPPSGGGMVNLGQATLTNVTISDNTLVPHFGLPSLGGGIYNSGSATLTNVTISGNMANSEAGGGGGIYNSGTLTATNSTISGNAAADENLNKDGRGGGIYNYGGTLTLTNSTISANTAIDFGGGIYTNTFGGTVQLKDTIVANPGTNCAGAAIVSLGHNLDSGSTCVFTALGDLGNTDPKLGPLQDNGGPTFTQALLPGSPAIGAGSPDCPPPATDQRGVARTSPCDIGAYETDASPSTATPTGTAPSPVTATPTQTPTLRACIGDCAGRYAVGISDLVTLVNVTLGSTEPSACPHGVPSGTGVTIALIIQAVNNALSGCP